MAIRLKKMQKKYLAMELVNQRISGNTKVDLNTEINFPKPLETEKPGLVRLDTLVSYELAKKANYNKNR